MVETIPRARPTAETVRALAALHGLRFDEERLAELAAAMAVYQEGLAALEAELDWVEPAIIHALRPEAGDGGRLGE